MYKLFEGYGVEVEYMIVDRQTLCVRPIADRLIARANNGIVESELDFGLTSWSNEMSAHLIELKTSAPTADFLGAATDFAAQINRINRLLEPEGAMLMPTAMHPLMNPQTDAALWPGEYHEIYAAFDRIFNFRRHGWANLQSIHINLPFEDENQFARLHAAIRLALPLIPALAASSPIADGEKKPKLDYRMEVYRTNSAAYPEISGAIIPEPVYSEAEYQRVIYDPMMKAVAAVNEDKILEPQWLNARGAIARFDRNSIEIRVIDSQECAAADFAVVEAVAGAVRSIYRRGETDLEAQKTYPSEKLAAMLWSNVAEADRAIIDDRNYLDLIGASEPAPAADIWRCLISENDQLTSASAALLNNIYEHGVLARRIADEVGGDIKKIATVYRRLCQSLEADEMFLPEKN